MSDDIIQSFSPIIENDSVILILGSMPGVESLNKNQYYAHPRNQFWKIIFKLFSEEYKDDYSEKLRVLKKNKIALWEVLKSCIRKGSLDSDITNEIVNDFSEFFMLYPNIKYVYFNGAKAYDTFRKKVGFELFKQIEFIKLTSTSPANTISFEEKLNNWSIIKNNIIKKDDLS